MIRNLIRVKRLGLLPYEEAHKIQLQHVDEVLQNRPRAQTLLIVEHTPVYTVGIRGTTYSNQEADRLIRLGADFVKTNRGGLITFHGPGQLVAYPILDLNSFTGAPQFTKNHSKTGDSEKQRNLTTGGVKWYVAQLEGTLVETCYDAGVKSAIAPGFPRTGVWTRNKKIASIGIHTRDAVTSHGIALNCDLDLKWFDHIVPCGLDGCQMTSLSQELGRRVGIEEATELFLAAFKNCLQCDIIEE